MVVKRKHEEMEAVEKVETAAHPPPASSSRKMQGQIDNKHSIDSDEEEDDRKEHEKFDKIHEDDIEGQEDDSELMMDGDIKVTPSISRRKDRRASSARTETLSGTRRTRLMTHGWTTLTGSRLSRSQKRRLRKRRRRRRLRTRLRWLTMRSTTTSRCWR